MNKEKKHLLYLAGSTAVGKTSVSIKLAQHFKTVVVSCDARQMYQQMEIGTAKPTAEELAAVPHYFINHLPITADYTAADFERDALLLLEELFLTKDLVVLTGGSGMYANALINGLDEMPSIDEEISDLVKNEFEEKGVDWLKASLEKEDPELFSSLNNSERHNPQRLMRALAFFRTHQKSLLHFRKKKPIERPFTVLKIGLHRGREILYDRINRRVDLMLAEGLVDEVKRLLPFAQYNAMQTVGYREIVGYLKGEYDLAEAIRLLKRNTRRYAKRQMTWYRRSEEMVWFHPNKIEEMIEWVENKKAQKSP